MRNHSNLLARLDHCVILRSMNTTRLITSVILLLCILGLAACGPVADVIGDRDQPTPTSRVLTTATPGGRLSVWLITPTGQAAVTPTPGVVGGNPVGPNATATAAIATIQAATLTAAAPPPVPYYQPNDCPLPAAPAPPPRPDTFDDFSVVIGRYLSGGGSSTVVEATLRNWGALTDRGGLVQADTDLTGDGVLEVIVTLYNPMTYNAEALLNAGQLLVYGCDGGGYRLLYKTQFNQSLALPELLRVGDMNADVRNELVFFIETCGTSGCYKEAKILSWNAIVGAFEELNSGQIVAINGRIGIADVENDGILELTAQINPPGTSASGPPHSVIDVWDWNGVDYLLAQRQETGSRYRIHALYEADDRFRAGELRPAILDYDALRKDNSLLSWTISGEYEALRAYAAFRIVIGYARLNNGRANDWLSVLQSENPAGTTGSGFAAMGTAFMDNFRATNDARAACAQAISTGATQPNVLSILNSYGYNNRSYTLNDLCPF
ncbi:MAG: hypothetical protein HY866_20450 [Chloroflexi bacterium]|nr:hypothetical protein [Chloroflexota bacterium]